MVRELVVLSGAAAVFVNYTRTPDAAFPQAINEIICCHENGLQNMARK
jgi:acetyl esterase/lipase